MVDVFISYPQRERDLMLPLKARLEALGLILFVDVDGRLDGEATFPEALDKGVVGALGFALPAFGVVALRQRLNRSE